MAFIYFTQYIQYGHIVLMFYSFLLLLLSHIEFTRKYWKNKKLKAAKSTTSKIPKAVR